MKHQGHSRVFLGNILVLLLALLSSAAYGDEWLLPTVRSYLSSDKMWRFTVTPRPVESGLAYFDDKVAHRKNAGSPPTNKLTHAQGLLAHRDSGGWKVVWNKPLLNEVSPVSALVSTEGQAVTFDNWHSMGYGKNVVVIYDASGSPVRAFSLDDFLPKEYIEALPHTVSSIWWGSDHRISDDSKQLILGVVTPTDEKTAGLGESHSKHIELAVDLATGALPSHTGAEWISAFDSAMRVNAAARRSEQERTVQFIAPLLGPNNDSEQDWHQYLIEAFFRVDPNWKEGYPATEVLRLPESADYAASVGFVTDALRDRLLNKNGVIMIASPSQDNLVRVLSEIVPTLVQGSLTTTKIYVAVNDSQSSAVAKVLAPTGAKYIQLDPGKPIPQRKARLDAYEDSSSQNLSASH